MRAPETYPVAWPEVRLAPETGAMELAVAEWVAAQATRPRKVTAILGATLAGIDGQPVTPGLLRRLSTGTREWLVQQVAAQCRPVEDWHELRCTACGACHDTAFDLAAMPRSAVAPEFPTVRITRDGKTLHFEVPNGQHEALLANRPDTSATTFLAACALDDATREVLSRCDDDVLSQIESALDDATPETADTVSMVCPHCEETCEARIDPLAYAFPPARTVLRDVHMLSSSYKWSEDAILAMPLHRRRVYVGMISEAKGVA